MEDIKTNGDWLEEVVSQPVAHLRPSPSLRLSSRTRHDVTRIALPAPAAGKRSQTGKEGLPAGRDTDDNVEVRSEQI